MRFHKHFLAVTTVVLAALFGACVDRFDDYQNQVIGDGEAQVETVLEFDSSVANLGRSDGNAIKDINKLSIVIFNNDGTFNRLIDNISFTPLQSTTQKPSDYPSGPNGEDLSSDNATAKVQCKFTLPYGRYHIYAVTNYYGADLTEAKLNGAEDPIQYLKSIRCEWNQKDISANAQMFGYFTNDIAGQDTAYDGDSKPGNGVTTAPTTQEPTVLVNQPSVSLYSWVKRLASKVTISFNGANLHNGVYVYIHNVSIRQIPLSCALGEENKPTESEVTPAAFGQSVTESDQALYYDSKGAITTSSPYDYTGDKYKNWMFIAKGSGELGAAEHKVADDALFFYENMQGVHPDKPKPQQPDKVGTNVGPTEGRPDGYTDEDYRDDVPAGTFIEVEGYYRCDIEPVSYGPIRYRFMLGQNISDNYDAIRNCHYKLTLGFNGYANQPDWHIEYNVQENEIYAPEAYIPYTYNTSVAYPIHFTGNLIGLEAEVIENNWAPYYNNQDGSQAPPNPVGTTNYDERTLQLQWNRVVYLNGNGNTSAPSTTANLTPLGSNTESNYLYGRHRSGKYYLDEEGNNTSREYLVTPIWAGFLRLQVPSIYENDNADIPAVLLYNQAGENSPNHYSSEAVLTNFRNYYFGRNLHTADATTPNNNTNLSARTFDVSNVAVGQSVQRGNGKNQYTVKKGIDIQEKEYTDITINLWTQPKTMCGNSGFSGNNPYEDFDRKAVVRFTATFQTPQGPITKRKDVTVYQTKRLVNPKAVWRRHDNPQDFNVTLMERDVTNMNDLTKFTPVRSQGGGWRARIKAGNESNFISLKKLGESTEMGGNVIEGNTDSKIEFIIDFKGKIDYDASECAIIEITYNGNSCVHNIFVRQGYHLPLRITNTANSTYWSSYNLFSCPTGVYDNQTAEYPATLTRSPLAFGAFFKKGNYAQAISVSNITNYGPMAAPNGGRFDFVTNPPAAATWNNISGHSANDTWHWASFNITRVDDNGVSHARTYTVPTANDYQDLMNNADFGIGVMYGDGATEPAETTRKAYGFLDTSNYGYYPEDPNWPADMRETCTYGMRGFIVYNNDDAHQIFFPIGTSGIGRRTIQGVQDQSQRGILRYGSLPNNDLMSGRTNCMRPVSYNIAYAPGAIYWLYQRGGTGGNIMGWDMNYFDLNFNGVSNQVVSTNNASIDATGGGGDALPIRLVTRQP